MSPRRRIIEQTRNALDEMERRLYIQVAIIGAAAVIATAIAVYLMFS